jgi:ligand-binding sensor domain-containing protein
MDEMQKDSGKTLYKDLNETIESYNNPMALKNDTVFSIRANGLIHRLFSGKDLNAPHQLNSKIPIMTNSFTDVFTTNNRVMVVTNMMKAGKIIVSELKHERMIQIFENNTKTARVNNVFVDSDVWLATYNGVLHFDSKGNLLHHFLKGKIVGNVIKDNEGSYWFCTPSDGIYVIPSLKMKIFNTNFQIKKLTYDGSNHIYFGTTEGNILAFDEKEKQYKNVHKVDNFEDFQSFNWLQNKYNALFFTNKSYFSINNNNEITNYNKSTKENNNDFIKTIKESAQLRDLDYIYSATSLGAVKWKGNNANYICYNDRRFSCVKANPQKKEVWFGSAEGFIITNEKDSVREIKTPFSVTDFAISAEGKVWIATDRQGLVLIENDKIIRNWKQPDGLIGSRVQKIIADNNNVFWLTTDGGIQRFDANDYSFRSITRANILLGTTIYDMTITNNDVWVATSKGVQFFPKDISLTPSVKPTLFIESVFINNKKIDSTDNTYFFNQNATNIQVNFTGLSYFSSDRFLYRYRIPQLDSTWISTEPTSNYARFQSLSNGKYTFEVQLVTEDGRTSDVKSIAIRVRPIIWKQWWFFTLVALGTIITITIYYRRIIGRIKERNLFEQKATTAELDKTRAEEAFRRAQLSALKAQMNPHFLFNALNSIQAYIFSNEKKEANAYLGKFSDLMRQTLEMSQNDTIPLDDEIQMLELYLSLESMRLKNELVWTVKTAPNINRFNTQIPPLLIQPYLENGIKHGLSPKKTDRKISVYFYQNEDNYLICEVSDNGIGRTKAHEYKMLRQKQHTSFSTSATEQRLNLLNLGRNDKIMVEYEDLFAADGTPAGTKAIIRIAV